MNIKTTSNGTDYTIAIDGRLDTTTAPELNTEITENCANAEKITLDISKLEYISSAGLRVILATHKMLRAKGGLVVKSPCEIVSEIFDVTGFVDIINIEK